MYMKTTSFFFIFVVAVFVSAVPSCFSADQQYESCLSPLSCGHGSTPNISYPFWGVNRPNHCGLKQFQLFCKNNQSLILELDNISFRVMSFDPGNKTITVAEESLFTGLCPDQTLNFTGNNQYTLAPTVEIIDLFTCSSDPPLTINNTSSFTCRRSNTSLIYYAFNIFERLPANIGCTKVGEFPVIGSAYGDLQQSKLTLEQVFMKGFHLNYSAFDTSCDGCIRSGGICGATSTDSESFQCLCPDKPYNSMCPESPDRNGKFVNLGVKISIGAASALTGILIAVALAVILCKRHTSSRGEKSIEAPVLLKRYRYAEVKRITKSFTCVVGKGGFGTVYRGTLCDGRVVAVKVLKDSQGNGEDFINEVASISNTSHVNIVTLLGFCYQGSKRAIIYEFLENGSLDKFISSKKSSGSVDWNELYGIALGVARGLEYLHNGCRARIVHFDIKPQNVLLDDNLCPKVSDFGLAKLCENKESILSSMNTRGTIGYIAPEVFSRMYGRVSHKSDVYSYGMLVLEMIGARNKTSNEESASNASSMYFPEWIYKDLEKEENKRRIENGMRSEEEEIVKKMTLVGLWCIQSSPSDRPSMNRVVEMMEGSIDALQVPPKPVLQFSLVPHTEFISISEANSVPSEALSNP